MAIANSLSKALLDMSALQYTWLMHVALTLTKLSSSTNLWLILGSARLADGRASQRTARSSSGGPPSTSSTSTSSLSGSGCCGLPSWFYVWCKAVLACRLLFQGRSTSRRRKQGLKAAKTVLRAAVSNLTRPLFLAPILTAAHGSWAFRTK